MCACSQKEKLQFEYLVISKKHPEIKRGQMEILEMKSIVTQIKRTQWMSLTAEWRQQRKE